MHRDYEVGYGKPPEHTRFKKGQSGNPKGRPKRPHDLKSALARLLGETITVREGERTTRIPVADALVKSAFNKALRGDMRATIWLVENLREELPDGPHEPTAEERMEASRRVTERFSKLFREGEQKSRAWQARREEVRRLLRERGIPEQQINDAYGVPGMEPPEKEQRREAAVKFMQVRMVPQELIDVATGAAHESFFSKGDYLEYVKPPSLSVTDAAGGSDDKAEAIQMD